MVNNQSMKILKKYINKNIVIAFLIWLIIWYWSMAILENKTSDHLIWEFYDSEVAANVSAHGLRKKINDGDKSFVLVDVRSQEEYLEWHIIWAISIPAYTDRDNTWQTSNERILEQFRELWSDKEIITYCYSAYCMSSRKIGKFLAKNWVYVKHLTVGWNEWRYHWDLWNYPHEEDETEKYIASWAEPGKLEWEGSDSCGISGDFGC